MDTFIDEIIVSKDDLIDLFEKETLKDTKRGWTYNNELVEIVALHEVDPKYINDITNANFYKIKKKKR